MQRLRQLGEELIEESGHDKETKTDIEAQLQDFDDCWNHVAKRVIDEKEKVRKSNLWLLLLTFLLRDWPRLFLLLSSKLQWLFPPLVIALLLSILQQNNSVTNFSDLFLLLAYTLR